MVNVKLGNEMRKFITSLSRGWDKEKKSESGQNSNL